MKKIKKINLLNLSKEELDNKELILLRGGVLEPTCNFKCKNGTCSCPSGGEGQYMVSANNEYQANRQNQVCYNNN